MTAAKKPTKRERPGKAWIWPSTWMLVDRQVFMQKEETLIRIEARRLGRQISRSLEEDHRKQAHRAG